MSFQDTRLVSMRARKEIRVIFPRKVKKSIVGEQFLFYFFLQRIKYTNLENLRPLIHGSSVDLKTLLWIIFLICVCLGTVSIRFFFQHYQQL